MGKNRLKSFTFVRDPGKEAATCLGKGGGQQKGMGSNWIGYIIIMAISIHDYGINWCWGYIAVQKYVETRYKFV